MENTIIIAIATLLICLLFKWKYSYWARKTIAGPAPLPIFGNYFECFFMQRHFADIIDEIYSLFPRATYIGFYKFHVPCLLIRDTKLINRILVSDLAKYYETDYVANENLYLIWKQNALRLGFGRLKSLRNNIKNYFSKDRFTEKFIIVQSACRQLLEYIDGSPDSDGINGYDVKDLSVKFTLEATNLSAFGLDSECFTNPNPVYMEFYKKYFTAGSLEHCTNFLKKILWYQTVEQRILQIFEKEIKDRVAAASTEKKMDLLDYLMSRNYDLNNAEVIINSVLELQEIFERTSTLIAYALYELAASEDIQSKVRTEIKEVLYLNKGELNEKTLRNLPYLDSVLFETQRLHSHIFTLTRRCIKEHEMPLQMDTSTTCTIIEAGTPVVMPIYSIHVDSNNFTNPYIFNPERYLQTSEKSTILYPFPGFYKDSQFCLGMDFAFMMAKIAVASIAFKYEISLSPKSSKLPEFSKKTFHLYSEDGVWLNLHRKIA